MIEELGYDGKRIFDFEISKDRSRLILCEACDQYFEAKLTKDQVLELIADFAKLAEQMV